MRGDEHPEELIDRAMQSEGALDQQEQATLDQHLAACAVCAAQLALAARFERELAPQPRDEVLDARAFEGAMLRMRQSRPLGRWRASRSWVRWAAAGVLFASGAVGAAALIAGRISFSPALPAPAPAVESRKPAAPAPAPAREAAPADVPAPPESPAAPAPPAAHTASAPARPTVTAAVLFERGEKLRREGHAGAAIAIYRHLQTAFPATPEARLSFAFAGQILLEQRRPDAALAQFDRHLAAGGEVGEEALAGRATALEQLHRTGEAIAAWKSLLARYPGSVYAERARARLDQLRLAEPRLDQPNLRR